MSIETNSTILNKQAENLMSSYHLKLPKSQGDVLSKEQKINIIDLLQNASSAYAACISDRQKNSDFHLKLAHCLEEKYLLHQMFVPHNKVCFH